jgi:hypothetical protein
MRIGFCGHVCAVAAMGEAIPASAVRASRTGNAFLRRLDGGSASMHGELEWHLSIRLPSESSDGHAASR